MNQTPMLLIKDDVISLKEKVNNLPRTFKVAELVHDLWNRWAKNNNEKLITSEGLDCQLLRPNGQGWETGKLRVVIEFCPDVPEMIDELAPEQRVCADSPLDVLR